MNQVIIAIGAPIALFVALSVIRSFLARL